jgi:uncharacterized cupin superfamily protein
MPKIDLDSLPLRTGTGYPPPFDASAKGRSRKRLGDAGGLTQFGVNLCTLEPGAASAQRHWHHNQDEFVLVLSGQLVLHEDGGEIPLEAGDACTFKAGEPDGHCIVNKSDQVATILEVGSRTENEIAEYPDIDLRFECEGDNRAFVHKDGTPY